MTNDEREVLIDVLVMTRMSDFAGTDVSIISDAATDILKKFTLHLVSWKRVKRLQPTFVLFKHSREHASEM